MWKYLGASFSFFVMFVGCSGGADEEDLSQITGMGASQPFLGTACETSSDCGEDLNCHADSAMFIVDGQCTASCRQGSDCAPYGAHTMCIAAGLCVATCAADAECPARTRCGEAGWCERTGPGSGRPYCSGTATPCASLRGTDCDTQTGCRDASTCTGVAADCGSLTDVLGCAQQSGCEWSSVDRRCTGSALACSSLTTDVACQDQHGCTWNEACSGQVGMPDCSKLSAALCHFTQGCALMEP